MFNDPNPNARVISSRMTQPSDRPGLSELTLMSWVTEPTLARVRVHSKDARLLVSVHGSLHGNDDQPWH